MRHGDMLGINTLYENQIILSVRLDNLGLGSGKKY